MRRGFYLKHKNIFSHFSGFFSQNPVLERGLVLAPVIVASINARNSFVLGTSFFIITFITVLIAKFVPKAIPYTLRVIIYTLIACAVFVPTGWLMSRAFVGCLDDIGVWLPLLCANSLIVVKSQSRFHKKQIGEMLLDLFCNCAGFFCVILLVGCIREVLSFGTIFGITLLSGTAIMPAAIFPFCGFILVGMLAAGVRAIHSRLMRPKKRRTNTEEEEI